MTKMSDLKKGDRFLAELVHEGESGTGNWINIRLPGGPRIFINIVESGSIEVTRLPDPPRPLVAGERIKSSRCIGLVGVYVGNFRETDFILWDNDSRPCRVSYPATTEHYEVIK